MKWLKWVWNTFSKNSTPVLCIVTIIIMIIAIQNYCKFVKNIELTHKPIVYINRTVIPQDEIKNPFKHGFIITNIGKLPARDIKVSCVMNQASEKVTVIDCTLEFPVFGEPTLYPNEELLFWIPNVFAHIPTKAEAIFTIYYSSEASEKEIHETQKLIFSKETNYTWKKVGLEFDTFKRDREKIEKKLKLD